jgi:hypothetical protein
VTVRSARTRYELNRPVSAIPCPQGIWQGDFSESRVTATNPAGLAELRQRVAANSLCPRGSEFVGPVQGKFRDWQGIRKVGQGARQMGCAATRRGDSRQAHSKRT